MQAYDSVISFVSSVKPTIPDVAINNKGTIFKVNDKVRVIASPPQLKKLQENHGNYISELAEYCYKIGTVHRITINKDLRIKFGPDENSIRYTFNPDALELVYFVGDKVKIIPTMHSINNYQRRKSFLPHIDDNIAQKSAKIVAIIDDDVLKVQIDDKFYLLNRDCVDLEQSNMTILKSVFKNQEETQRVIKYQTTGILSQSSSFLQVDKSEFQRLQTVEKKYEELCEAFTCIICMDELRKLIFLCGHGACSNCASELNTCPMCREKISRKIQLY